MWPEGSFELSSSGRLREEVEQLQPQVRAERLAEAPRDLRRALVAELGEPLQVFLEPLEHDGQIHDDITMTSLTTSVKCQPRHQSAVETAFDA